jgi:hypothetical protein
VLSPENKTKMFPRTFQKVELNNRRKKGCGSVTTTTTTTTTELFGPLIEEMELRQRKELAGTLAEVLPPAVGNRQGVQPAPRL